MSRLEAAWKAVQANGRWSKSDSIRGDIARFSENSSFNLRSIQSRLVRSKFKFEAARGVPAKKASGGGIRPIIIAPIESRIVQRAILDELQLLPSLQPYFRNPYSFGGIKRRKDDGLAAVPGAIDAVSLAIHGGCNFVVCADISAFFTRISKEAVSKLVHQATDDEIFMGFFDQAIRVELENLAKLRQHADRFPTEDLGVAQGSSLSPLLGNMILAEFDQVMNQGDCRCIRYIDDFIILAPSRAAARARLKKARETLGALGMTLSESKTMLAPRALNEGFEFLGVEILPGLIRPTVKARTRFLQSLKAIFEDSRKQFIGYRNGQPLPKHAALLGTLKRADGAIQGWGKHYRFCTDRRSFTNVDIEIAAIIKQYLGFYGEERRAASDDKASSMLGIELLSNIDFSSKWLKRHAVDEPAGVESKGTI